MKQKGFQNSKQRCRTTASIPLDLAGDNTGSRRKRNSNFKWRALGVALTDGPQLSPSTDSDVLLGLEVPESLLPSLRLEGKDTQAPTQNIFKLIAAGPFHPGGLHGFNTGSLPLYTPKEPNFSMKSAHQSPKNKC